MIWLNSISCFSLAMSANFKVAWFSSVVVLMLMALLAVAAAVEMVVLINEGLLL